MSHQDSVFNQLLKALPSYQFDRIVQAHQGDYRVRQLRCRDQFMALLYAQLTGRRSLRDLEVSFNAQRRHFYHLGCRQPIKRSTLSDANNTRPVKLYERLFDYSVTKGLQGKGQRSAQSCVKALDASTVVLNKTRFGWATGHNGKAGIKLHTVYDLGAQIPTYFEVSSARSSDLSRAKPLTFEAGHCYVFDRGYYDFSFWQQLNAHGCTFITRLKHNSPTTIIKRYSPPQTHDDGLLSDDEVQLNQRLAQSRRNPYQGRLREIQVIMLGTCKPIRILTNDMQTPANTIAAVYKKRWQIELFFKWIKQNLKIKTFLGTSENAVKIQVIVAMIAYILLRLFAQQQPIKTSLLVVSRLIQTNLMRRERFIHILAPPQTFHDNHRQLHNLQNTFTFA